MDTSIMTPQHPRWSEFIERLQGPEGCNFGQDFGGQGRPVPGTFQRSCTQKTDRPFTRAILAKMEDIDIAASLAFFNSRGGYCDCEIVFNVNR